MEDDSYIYIYDETNWKESNDLDCLH